MSRAGILFRTIAAALGGYSLSAWAAACLALALPMARSEAVLTATMFSFLLYVCAILWAFAVSSALRAWIGLGVANAVLAAVFWTFLNGNVA